MAGGQPDEEEEEEEEDEENMTWLDYYMNGKGGEVGMSNLGNTSVFSVTTALTRRASLFTVHRPLTTC